MGRAVTVAKTCDRCGVGFEDQEIDLLAKDTTELVDETKEGLSEVPVFEATLGGKKLKYYDLCEPCDNRLETLFKEMGPVKRRGHKRKATTAQTELNTEGGNGEKDSKEKDKKTGAKPPAAPAKPKGPKAPPTAP